MSSGVRYYYAIEQAVLMDIVRPAITSIRGYVPGEQPQTDGWLKLNTNENPYPASPMIADAVNAAITKGLQVYPDPHATSFREAAAEVYNVDPDWILPANGSDENLTILLRTFVEPQDTIAFPYPGYVLYDTLGRIQGCNVEPILLDSNWNLSDRARQLAEQAKLVLVPNPNSPSGTFMDDAAIDALIPKQGLLVLDGAYADFADSPQQPAEFLNTARQHRVVFTRTLSKSYSLAGLRFGFAIGHPDLIAQMGKVKDSYNCDALAIAAATAAMKDQDWMLANRAKILATRARAQTAFSELGFTVTPSEANFLWMTHPTGEHKRIYEQLKERQILIRYMQFPLVKRGENDFDGLRVTIGTDQQVDSLLTVLQEII